MTTKILKIDPKKAIHNTISTLEKLTIVDEVCGTGTKIIFTEYVEQENGLGLLSKSYSKFKVLADLMAQFMPSTDFTEILEPSCPYWCFRP